jgi:hypothetical protein
MFSLYREYLGYLHKFNTGFEFSLLADMHKKAMPVDSSFSFSFPSIDAAVI